jgi:ribosomal protein S18 acetylase RimI-like enzyme
MLRDVFDVYREQGLRGVWFGLLARTFYRRLDLVELDLADPPPLAGMPFPLEFGFLEKSEAAEYAELGAGVDVDEALRRMGRGERCFVARSDGRIVSGRWLATGRAFVTYLDRVLELADGDVYVYESFTDPARRGKAVSAAAGTRLAELLAEQGRRRMVAATLRENRPGQRIWRKAGYRHIGTIGYVKLGPWRRHFLRAHRRGAVGR